jgi:adenine/guanine/hypoxanthine permease
MMQSLARIDMTDLVNAVPIVLALLVTALTDNLVNGMAWGTPSLFAPEVTMGCCSEIPAIVWGLGVVFLGYAVVTAQIF